MNDYVLKLLDDLPNSKTLVGTLSNLDVFSIDDMLEYLIKTKDGSAILNLYKSNIITDKDAVYAIISISIPKYMYELAKCHLISNEGKDILAHEIVKHSDVRSIYLFARDIKCSKNVKEQLEDKIISLGNLEYIRLYATYIMDANTDKLQKAIINSNNAKDIYLFAIFVKDANIKMLAKAIIKTDDELFIRLMASVVYGYDIDLKDKSLTEVKRMILEVIDAPDELMDKCAVVSKLLDEKNYQALITVIDECKDVFVNGHKEYSNVVKYRKLKK